MVSLKNDEDAMGRDRAIKKEMRGEKGENV